MRAAVLVLAFDHLGARFARSSAFVDNATSRRVSERLGHVDDGVEYHDRRGAPVRMHRLRVDPSTFRRREHPVTVEGLAACSPLLGVA